MAATGIDGDQDVSMLGAGLLGAGLLGGGTGIGAGAIAAGAAGAALLASGAGGPEAPETRVTPETLVTPVVPVDPVDPRTPPTIDGTGRTDTYGGDNLTDAGKVITVTGTAEAGSEVTVVVAGETDVVYTLSISANMEFYVALNHALHLMACLREPS